MKGFLIGTLVVTLTAASACARAGARTVANTPPLEMPPPPPRLVETVDVPPPPPLPLVEEPQRQPVLPPPRQAPRVEAAKPVEGKSDAAQEGKVPEESPKPVPALQTTPAVAEGGVERSIRGLLDRATADLGRVNYQALSADAKNQYDTAKRFIQQADAELRTTRNLVFAKNLADKAAALGAQLAGR